MSHIPQAQGQAAWIAYLWISGMAVLAGLVIWLGVTGRLFTRHRRGGDR